MSSRRPWACSWRCNSVGPVHGESYWQYALSFQKHRPNPESLSQPVGQDVARSHVSSTLSACVLPCFIPCWWWTKPLKLWACPQLNDFCYKSCRVVVVLEQWLQHSDMVVPLCYSGGGLKTWVFNTQRWLSLCEGSCGGSPGLLLHRGSFSRPEALHDSVLTDSASFPTSCGTSFGVVWMELVPVSFWEWHY